MPEATRETGIALERLSYGLLAQADEARAAARRFAARDRRDP